MVDDALKELAETLLDRFRAAGLKIVTAESCTGGLIGALLTSAAGSSDVYERGYITYSNEAKEELLGVSSKTLVEHGAVSAQTAREMAQGALARSHADIAVSVTGIAGPGGGSEEKPVGLVYAAVASAGLSGAVAEEYRFGDIGREAIRRETARNALEMAMTYGCSDDDA